MVQNVSTDTEHDNVSEYPVMQESHEYLVEEKVSVKRGKIKEFTTYEVSDYELVLLERGSDASLWLNFGVALLSIFFSLLAALLTLDSESKQTVFIVLTIITAVCGVVGFICLMFWWKNRSSQKDIIRKIRKRIL